MILTLPERQPAIIKHEVLVNEVLVNEVLVFCYLVCWGSLVVAARAIMEGPKREMI